MSLKSIKYAELEVRDYRPRSRTSPRSHAKMRGRLKWLAKRQRRVEDRRTVREGW